VDQLAFLRREWFLLVAYGSCLALVLLGEDFVDNVSSGAALALLLAWLFAATLGSALSAVRHADRLALLLGEPYGTLILTISVTLIEVVSIAAVMLHGQQNPTLARDTMLAVVMIILNGMVGLSLLLGGWRHQEQHYNLQGANAYLGTIIPLVVLSLVLPTFAGEPDTPALSGAQQVFLVATSLVLYTVFVATQTGRHRDFFVYGEGAAGHAEAAAEHGVRYHAALLVAYLAPVVFLAERLAAPVNYLIETVHMPAALGRVLIALMVATPEAVGAVRAAAGNQIQRSINIFLGSVLSTIGLTVPTMILVALAIGHPLVLGVTGTDLLMLLLTLAVSVVTFASGHTNILQGAVHLVLFAAYLMLILLG
jgi:Ca2+:H+ antiporter